MSLMITVNAARCHELGGVVRASSRVAAQLASRFSASADRSELLHDRSVGPPCESNEGMEHPSAIGWYSQNDENPSQYVSTANRWHDGRRGGEEPRPVG